jgi:SAM-dependent methyltransferase
MGHTGFESVPCVLCGSSENDPVVTAADRLAAGRSALSGREKDDGAGAQRFTVVRCRGCGLAYTDPRPTAEHIGDYYPDYHAGPRGALGRLEDWYQRRQHREIVRWLAELKPQRGKLLDVGCGAGDLLLAARSGGWHVSGVEPTPDGAARARDERGLEVVEDRFESAPLPTAGFDVVVLSGALEHMHDPVVGLTRARELLASGGLVAVVSLPRIDSPQARWFGPRWLALDLPRHLYHFDDHSFRRLASICGLRVTATRAYSRRHSAAMLVASLFPTLQKHRFNLADGESPSRLAAKKAAYLILVTVARPYARLEASRGRAPQMSYFLEPLD